MTSSEPARSLRSSKPWRAAALLLWVGVAACSSGSKSPTVASVTSGPITTAGQARPSAARDSLAAYQAYAQCMRSHGVTSFPDPVTTPSGSYGFRTQGVDPKSSAFQSAGEACRAQAPEGWGDSGKPLTPAQQQQWLNWAKCIRTHGVPDFPDPTFGNGGTVGIARGGESSPQVQTAMDACKAQMPTTGGLGG
ncbi:MAG: hypothetical protein QOG97_2030 [Acidimicrobiaceae bacterium]|jgi:hypothetical protein|nr:hypothetical protein [Acidimicrobiaceae bacterium]